MIVHNGFQVVLQKADVLHREVGEVLQVVPALPEILSGGFGVHLTDALEKLVELAADFPFAQHDLPRVRNQLQILANALLEVLGRSAQPELALFESGEVDLGLQIQKADKRFGQVEDPRGFFRQKILLDVQLEKVVFQRQQRRLQKTRHVQELG